MSIYFVTVDDYEIPGEMEFLVSVEGIKEARQAVQAHYDLMGWGKPKLKQIKARRLFGEGNKVLFLQKHVHMQAASYEPVFLPKVEYA